ncbi:Fis family transcriptional regulator [Pseudomaricurvus alkylphenolicus]|uniref:Fis family transcriptional regulator n=1 Tax=Pseudomaricurvus alkylphenolicus TaxID=1306991 RepID=UPI00141E6038|nr:Fis family transcriptional regulator [Pseudomaricurvus alkylphenolicus]NIB40365.1 Fis family transcriptional regulator [Pseudomaricurvus alkylphenolicus]
MGRPKSKTQKRLENSLRVALTEACDEMLDKVAGFQWLTHQADYTNFPASLLVTCVFDKRASEQLAVSGGQAADMKKLIQAKLLKIGVKFKFLEKQVLFDNEEDCEQQHQGDWSARLASREGRAVVRNRPG